MRQLLSSAQSPEQVAAISQLIPNKVEAIVDAVPMCVLKHDVDNEKIKYLIVQEITKCSLMMNVANNINTPQIQFTAETIMKKYPAESVEDVILCLRRGSQGFYGSVYHQFDTSIIMGWMEKHIEEKSVYIERNNQTDKLQHDEHKVDYAAYMENQKRRLNIANEAKQKEREYWKQKADDILNPKRTPYTVPIIDVNGKETQVENVYASSPEHARQIVEKLIEIGEIKI